MKILTVCVLGCAIMVLARAAGFADSKAKIHLTVRSQLVKRALPCPSGWTQINERCFQYVPVPMSWAKAERNCQSMSANLASVHSVREYHQIQSVIVTASQEYKETWIGGSNAQEDSIWLWSDGKAFQYSNWCPGEPNNIRGWQHCIQINFGEQKCWDDVGCDALRPSVCVQKIG